MRFLFFQFERNTNEVDQIDKWFKEIIYQEKKTVKLYFHNYAFASLLIIVSVYTLRPLENLMLCSNSMFLQCLHWTVTTQPLTTVWCEMSN